MIRIDTKPWGFLVMVTLVTTCDRASDPTYSESDCPPAVRSGATSPAVYLPSPMSIQVPTFNLPQAKSLDLACTNSLAP